MAEGPGAGSGVTLMNPPAGGLERKVIETRLERAFADGAGQPGAALGVQVYTTGRDIFFGPGGAADPANRLLAHELAHVVQQGKAGR